jgi:hypothetical protein
MKPSWRVGVLLAVGGWAWAAFSDIPPGPLAEQVEQVAQAGWLQGYPDGTFRGQEPLNRYQLAGALGRVLRDLGVEAKPVAFKDVPPGHWVLEPLALAVAWGLVAGYPDGTFRGQEPLTRAALAVVLARLAERLGADKEAPLPWDVPKDHWAASAVRKVVGLGLMALNPDGSFGLNAVVNRYQLAMALAALKPWVEARRNSPRQAEKAQQVPQPAKAPEAPPSGSSAETLDLAARWVGMMRGQVVAVGEKVYSLAPEGVKELGPGSGDVVLPPWRLVGGVLEDGKNRYVPLGQGGGKEVLPAVFRRMRSGHLTLDPSGNYLLLVSAEPLCDCQSRVVRLVLLLSSPVGLYAEYVYLLDGPGNRVVGVAWPEPKNLLVLEEGGDRALLYRLNLNAGEDIAFTTWDEGGLEERAPLPVRPVTKVLLAELPLKGANGVALEGKDQLLTVVEGKLVRFQLPSALW